MQLVPGMNRSTTATGDHGCSFISSHYSSHSFNLRDIHSHLHREAKQNSRFISSSNTTSSLPHNSNRDNTWMKVELIHDRESHSIPWSIIERLSSDVAGVSPFVLVSILFFSLLSGCGVSGWFVCIMWCSTRLSSWNDEDRWRMK